MRVVDVINDSAFFFRFRNFVGGFCSVVNSEDLFPALTARIVAGFANADLVFGERAEEFVEFHLLGVFCVKQNGIVVALKHFARVRPLFVMPDDFVAEVLFAEDGVEH